MNPSAMENLSRAATPWYAGRAQRQRLLRGLGLAAEMPGARGINPLTMRDQEFDDYDDHGKGPTDH